MKKNIKAFFKKYNKLIAIATIAITITSLLGGSYAIFQKIDEAELANNYQTGNLQIEFDDTSEGLGGIINLEGAVPTSEANINTLPSYKFKITNIGNLSYKFDLKLITDSAYTESHGCANNQISANYIKIKLNDNPSILLSELTDSIIDEDITLLPKQSITYELKVWLTEGAPNTEIGKHYHGKITSDGNAIYTDQEDPSKANRPVLADGMIPVVHNGTTWVKANNKGNYNDWYDYGNKKWANAVMVSSATRDTYMTADIGTPVQEADILAYYVWIPRYKYQLFNVAYSSVSSQLINVEFERGTATTGTVTCSTSEIGVETCSNKANGNWYTHPAFTFGNEELQGIWVGKFETTYGTNTTNVYPDNTVYETPTIKPNVTSLRKQQLSKQFQTAQYFGTSAYLTNTGVNQVDAHMMKNIEWGAVAYLKQSTYGLGTTDIGKNSKSGYRTGCGPQSAGSTSSGSICYAYQTTLGMSASTTGNITGVYDMSGGAYENVMGVIQDNTTTGRSPMSGNSTSYNSGYFGKVYPNATTGYANSGNTLAFPAAKYYDLYANGTTYNDQTAYNRSRLGDATGETRSWYSDNANFPYANLPWFDRGGYYADGTSVGVFHFDNVNGTASSYTGFRVALSTTGA